MQRGNHETKNMNKIYGFEGEVKHKYDDTVMNLFTEVFNWLPIATTISNKPSDAGVAWSDLPLKSIFVVHGGLRYVCPDHMLPLCHSVIPPYVIPHIISTYHMNLCHSVTPPYPHIIWTSVISPYHIHISYDMNAVFPPSYDSYPHIVYTLDHSYSSTYDMI